MSIYKVDINELKRTVGKAIMERNLQLNEVERDWICKYIRENADTIFVPDLQAVRANMTVAVCPEQSYDYLHGFYDGVMAGERNG